jgi:dTDP-4-amino-4,6-dideoxygalactose transaminase/nucleoside-diphosphate-sugar epimerase
MKTGYLSFYRGRRVMVTGGLGFIGSNLVRHLVDAGADVLIVDSIGPDYGGNRFNIHGIEDRVRVDETDIRNQTAMDLLVADREVIFNLAGQVSHIDSMRDPYTDLDINCRAQLSMLEACRKYNPRVRVVYAGTRQVYGRPDRLPVDEGHLVRPADINGVNKAAGEYYHLLYNNVFGVRACSLRLTNVYGPRQLIRHNRQGFIGWFIRLAIEGGDIQIFGDGSQLRDFVYVDDAAGAFLRAGATDACNGEVFNVGGDEPISHRELVSLLIEVADEVSPHCRLGAAGRAARGARADDRLLSPAHAPLRWRVVAASAGVAAVIRFLQLTLGEDAGAVQEALARVVTRGWFILGPELDAFEQEFAAACHAPHAAGVGTGTDALAIALRALGIGPGDDVITSPLSAAYSALAIMMAGARPVFADIDADRLTLDPRAAAAAVTPRTAAIMPVHLYGQAADMPAMHDVARRHNLAIVEDCCQAHLATCAGRPVGSESAAAAYSFYPTKNLGALGDGGALTTRDPALAAKVKRLRNGGQTDKYRHDEFGVNSRLDEIQAAVLRARLPLLPGWTERRRALARRYREALAGIDAVVVPPQLDAGHVYHLFVVRCASRDAMQAHVRAAGIETLIHYPIPIPHQPALASEHPADCPIANRACNELLSLPLYPTLREAAVAEVAAALATFPGTPNPEPRTPNPEPRTANDEPRTRQ